MGADVITMSGNDTEVQDLRNWVDNYITNNSAKVSVIAAKAGIHRSSLSLFINQGKFSRNTFTALEELRARIEPDEIDSLRASDDTIQSSGSQKRNVIGVLHTEDFQQAIGICSMCHRDGEIGVIIGHAGSGKTTALNEFCKGRPDVVLIRAQITMTVKGLLSAIGEALGLGILSGSKENILTTVIASLRENPYMIIIDEADLLVDRTSVARIETLRAIWDETRCGLVICGMPKLAKYLVKGPGGDDNLAQVYSRVRRAYKMRGVTRGELMEILKGFNIEDQAKKYLITRGASLAHGGLRRLIRLINNALDMVADDEPITLEVVKEADGLLVTPEILGLNMQR